METMGTVNWIRNLDVLKTLNCCSKHEWEKAIGVSEWAHKESFERIWDAYKNQGIFVALCYLDQTNLKKLMEYVEQKYTNQKGLI